MIVSGPTIALYDYWVCSGCNAAIASHIKNCDRCDDESVFEAMDEIDLACEEDFEKPKLKFATDMEGNVFAPERVKILLEAAEVTHGDRDVAYGDPLDNHTFIADLWNVYLIHAARVRGDAVVRPDDVALLMALVKIARSVVSPGKRDHYVDGACYFAIAGEIVDDD